MVREIAERILFGTTLEEKLTPPPPEVGDEQRGEAIAVPRSPSRPKGLELRSDGVRAEFPGTVGIEDEKQRGKLLHFFANHELLATELMALVLLKFPEAPPEFRSGVLRTLKEEQMHTKLYLKRMAECGVDFGDLPVNGFFWNTVSSMTSPLDYVTRLSLTFEQANLDYARGYAEVFSEAGDPETAAILNRIYRDEIGHVNYGLHWFRKWKSEGSDWQEFVTGLHLPLSASRAKGAFSFNEEGRREAGLDEDFIQELRVCAQSKGRTPNVFWFNPGAEESLVTPEAAPTRAAGEMQRDLSLLPAYLARKEDVVIVPTLPPTPFLAGLLDAGIELPEIVCAERLPEIRERKLHELRPWARTPDAQPVINSLGVECVPTSRELFSKLMQTGFLRRILENSTNPLLCGPECVGAAVGSVEEVEDWMKASLFPQCVVKAPFSTAGRNRIICRVGEGLTNEMRVAIEELIDRQEALVIEPWLDRIVDFSLHYDMSDRGLKRRGMVVLENTTRGQFRRATVADRFTDFLDEKVRRVLFEGASRQGHLVEFMEASLEPGLTSLLRKHRYNGPVGVDSFLYRDLEGRVRWKPVVEINPRYTMGRVALELARFDLSAERVSLTVAPVGKGPAGSRCLTPCFKQTRWAAYLDGR